MLPLLTHVHGDYTIITMPFEQPAGIFGARFFAHKNIAANYPFPITRHMPSELIYEDFGPFNTYDEAIESITNFANKWVDEKAAQPEEEFDEESEDDDEAVG